MWMRGYQRFIGLDWNSENIPEDGDGKAHQSHCQEKCVDIPVCSNNHRELSSISMFPPLQNKRKGQGGGLPSTSSQNAMFLYATVGLYFLALRS